MLYWWRSKSRFASLRLTLLYAQAGMMTRNHMPMALVTLAGSRRLKVERLHYSRTDLIGRIDERADHEVLLLPPAEMRRTKL